MNSAAQRNEACFNSPAREQTYLRARGFADDGRRSGGMLHPLEVALPAGAVLLRLFGKEMFGDWWFTPYEMRWVIRHFGLDGGTVFKIGRSKGEGILHAGLAVRHEWGDSHPGHLGRFHAVRLRERLFAFVGVGDVAPDATQSSTLKPIRITGRDGKQRGFLQIFLPAPKTYIDAFIQLGECDTDAELAKIAAKTPF